MLTRKNEVENTNELKTTIVQQVLWILDITLHLCFHALKKKKSMVRIVGIYIYFTLFPCNIFKTFLMITIFFSL